MTDLLGILSERVILADAAMGSRVQAMDLDVERDYRGCENCTEILTRTRPDIVRGIHEGSLNAGADAVQTNSFGGSPVTLGEFGLADEAFDLNRASAELAHEAVAQFAGDGRDRFVLGSIGPGTRLPSRGHIDYDTLEDALTIQAAGLIAGEVDALIIETVQDLLQAKAAVNGGRKMAGVDTTKTTTVMSKVTSQTRAAAVPSGSKKIGRNEPCYCGSGKKYKRCHGA